jgi:predicted transcriptional regulator
MMKNLLRYPKLLEALSYLYNNQDKKIRVVDIVKNIDLEYSYLSGKIKFLKRRRLIETKNKGRESFISLTQVGLEIGKRISEIKGLLR